MSNKYGLFWNSNSGDRTYDADSFAEWLKPFFKNGVFVSSFSLTAGGGMTVSVGSGTAYINGKLRTFDTDTLLTIPTANGSYPRIDNIVVERNDTDREISLKVVQGTYSGASAAAINPTRANGIYQLVIARVAVGAGVTEITASNITDCRPDINLCGYVATAIDNPDFEEWYNLNQLKFEEWFGHVKGQLSTDAAGNLQNQITSTKYTISSSGTWEETTINNSTYYTYNQPIMSVYADTPTVSLVAASGVIPTAAEQAAYALVQFVSVDADSNILKLYATAQPASDFMLSVEGVAGVAPVAITKQPEDITIQSGDTATLSVEAIGTSLTYKWQYAWESTPTQWNDFAKGTSATISFHTDARHKGLQVHCIITDGSGNSITSRTTTVTLEE